MNSKDIYNSVCRVICDGVKNPQRGTCFFFEDKNKNVYIVSNKHVLCGDNNIYTKFYLNLNVINNETNKERSSDGAVCVSQNLILKSDTEDIAAYPINDIIESFKNKNISFNHYFLKEEDIFIDYKSLDYIENIISIGHPSGMKDAYSNRPIITNGITATPVMHDFEKDNRFLIDITSYEGSSGSPVFIKIKNSYKLLGVIHGCITRGIKINKFNNTIENNYIVDTITGSTDSTIISCVKSDSVLKLFN